MYNWQKRFKLIKFKNIYKHIENFKTYIQGVFVQLATSPFHG